MASEALKARRQTVSDLMTSINEDVARLPRPALLKLAPALRAAEKELEHDLQRWLGSVTDGQERFTAQHLRKALVQVRSGLAAIEKVEPELYATLRRGAVAAANLSTRHVALELARFSFRFGDSLNPIPLLEAATVSQRLLLDRFRKASSRWTDRQISDVRRKLTIGLLKNENFDQLTKRLMGPKAGRFSKDGAIGDRSTAIVKRIFSKVEYEASRIVRTEVIHAYNVVKEDQIGKLVKGDPTYRKKWDAALDSRVCPECRRLDGQVVKVDENFSGGISAPPLHAQCRCSLVTWNSEWD